MSGPGRGLAQYPTLFAIGREAPVEKLPRHGVLAGILPAGAKRGAALLQEMQERLLEPHAKDTAGEHPLMDHRPVHQRHRHPAVIGQPVLGAERTKLHAIGQFFGKLPRLPPLARRVELVGLVDELHRPGENRILRPSDAADFRPHLQIAQIRLAIGARREAPLALDAGRHGLRPPRRLRADPRHLKARPIKQFLAPAMLLAGEEQHLREDAADLFDLERIVVDEDRMLGQNVDLGEDLRDVFGLGPPVDADAREIAERDPLAPH